MRPADRGLRTPYLTYFILQFVLAVLIDHLYYIRDLDLISDWSTVLTSLPSDLICHLFFYVI
jgi:hypothetical protein